MSNNTRRYWTTKSISLAAFVFAKGGTLVGVHTGLDQAVFAFLNTPELQMHIQEHKSGPALIDSRLYDYALRWLQQHAADALMEWHGEA